VEALKATSSLKEEVYTLQGAVGEPKKRFTGMHLAHATTGESKYKRPRWLTLDLYRKRDSTYILHTAGYSLVYHVAEGCQPGEQMTLSGLLEETAEGVPCEKCNPMPFADIEAVVRDGRESTEIVSLERIFYTVTELADVPALIRSLLHVPKNSRTGTPTISRPGQELLFRAAVHDARIAAISDAVEDI
jgi:hypothetical protein